MGCNNSLGGNKKVRIAVVGLGRGAMLAGMLGAMGDVEVCAVCDVSGERSRGTADKVGRVCGKRPREYSDYNALFESEKPDGAVVATTWQLLLPVAKAAMRSGAHAAVEVGGAFSVDDCASLVRAHEETGKFCMALLNCNYGREELALLNMAKKGVFGEIVHLQCGYGNDSRESLARGVEQPYHRLLHHLHRNGELYPHHGLGPMMKLIGINRGNRMTSLVSVSSKAVGVKAWAKANLPSEHHIHGAFLPQGDIVTTIIKCAGGETILLTHDTNLPRPYSRGGRVQGTRGVWYEDNKSIYIEGESPDHEWEPFYEYIERNGYDHPLYKEGCARGGGNGGAGTAGGAGGTGNSGGAGGLAVADSSCGTGFDPAYLMLRGFVEDGILMSVPPIDTYETALLAAITPLSEQSVALGGQPVYIPDFTGGKWLEPRPSPPGTKYGLN